MKKSETAEDTDVSHQDAVSIHFGAHGKAGPGAAGDHCVPSNLPDWVTRRLCIVGFYVAN